MDASGECALSRSTSVRSASPRAGGVLSICEKQNSPSSATLLARRFSSSTALSPVFEASAAARAHAPASRTSFHPSTSCTGGQGTSA